ncbi:MAG: hypothetical protein KAT28_01385 [Candidatus Aenigmarchaeota archaeon]|nr:hypothetical protein [Candidatus Aenigmarchaeota archaeon]
MDISSIRIKERVAEEFYDKFTRSYQQNDLREASKNLWDCLKHLVLGLGFCKNKELGDKDFMDFLNEFETEITKDDINTIKAIHINSLRGAMDSGMFDIYKRKVDMLRNKLKNMIKDYLSSGSELDSGEDIMETSSDESSENHS